MEITEQEFEERFRPFENPGNEGMRHFEGEPDEQAFLVHIPQTHLWTQITTDLEGDGWGISYVPGWSGRGDGPIITLRPWTDPNLTVEVETHFPEN